ncbi:MAG: hypothetical protein IJB81_06880 [Clostridia bacterium]|nr:hypothetical protein [Clostridia bacterium]
MKRIAAFFLSILMLCMPLSASAGSGLSTEDALTILLSGLDRSLSGAQPGLQLTLTTPDGESTAIGFGKTTTGYSANYTSPDLALLINEISAYLTSGGITSATSTQALLNLLSQIANSGTPQLTPEDLQLLADVGLAFLQGLMTSDCITVSGSGSTMNLHIDLDGLLDLLDTLVPQALSVSPEKMEALLAKLTPYLFGQPVSLAQITDAWQQLGLRDIQTGLVLDATLMSTGRVIALIASCMNWHLKLAFSPSGLSGTLTTPEGIAYPFDTNDLQTVAGLLAAAPSAITEEAFQIEQTVAAQTYNGRSFPDSLVTTHLRTDLALVVRDLCTGLKQSINANAPTVDALLKKYQPWIDLFLSGAEASAPLTADALIQLLDSMPALSSVPGEATIVNNYCYQTVTIDAFLANAQFEADISTQRRQQTISAAFRIVDPVDYFELSLDGCTDYQGNTSCTLSSSKALGGCHALTFSFCRPSVYNSTLSIATDNDAFRLTVDTTRSGDRLDLHLGSFHLAYAEASVSHGQIQPEMSLQSSWPGGFVSLLVTDNTVEFDSNLLGFSYVETWDTIRMEGYVSEHSDAMYPNSFTFMLDEENEILTGSIIPYDGDAVHLTYRTGKLSILTGGSECIIADAHTGTPTQNTTTVTVDGEIAATVVTDVQGRDSMTIRLYPGAQTTGDAIRLELAFCAPGQPAPADAVTVSPEEFIMLLQQAFSPEEAAPLAEENTAAPEAAPAAAE